jgi:SAM-dependent methyltransferase
VSASSSSFEPGARLDYLPANIAAWTRQADEQRAAGRHAWARAEPAWGIFGVPESSLGLLPDDATGLRTVELGCGTAYVSAWLARRGAQVVAIDPTPSQLQIAVELQQTFGERFPLACAAAEQLPFADESFDFAISEYGAAIWADPYRWIPEAARVLRPGGELVMLGNSTLLMLCVPAEDGIAAGDELLRPLFGLHRMEWGDPPSAEFHLSHGERIGLLRANGFEVLDLVELKPEPGATTRYDFVTAEWATRWPCEEVWRARRCG